MNMDKSELPAGWQRQTLKELGSGVPGAVQTGPFGAQLHAEDYVEEGVPLILIRNIKDNGLDLAGLPRVTEKDAARLSRYQLESGDIVFSRVGRVGSCFLADEDHRGWLISGQLLRVRIKDTTIDHGYLFRALTSRDAQDHILGESVGTTRSSINTQILESLSLLIPNREEQTQIARVLATIDKAIEQTEAIIVKQQRIKTGLMQDLLTRGIDEHGNIRSEATHAFKDSPLGRIPVEWSVESIEAKLESLIDYRGRTPTKVDEGIPLLTAKNVRDGWLEEEPREFIAKHAYEQWMTRGFPSVGDVLFTTEAPMGNVARAPSYKFALAQRLLTLCPKTEELSGDYLFWLLHWPRTTERLALLTSGSTVTGIKQTVFRKVIFSFPQKDEQIRIIATLESHDNLRAIEETSLRKLHRQKAALMQDLLTGKVRVTPLLEAGA